MNNYTPIHIHSDYSLLDSTTKFQDYIDLAVKNGQKAIATTEHGMHRGWVAKKFACDKAGIKLLIGVEIYLTEQLEPKVRDNYHTVLIAKNQEGLKELNLLVGKSTDEEHFYYTNRISFEEFLNISDNIIKTSACVASPLAKLHSQHPLYERLARKYDYLEIQPHLCDIQKEHNRHMWYLSHEIGVPLIVGTDTHSSTQYKEECRSLLMTRKNKVYDDEESFDLVYKTYDELVEMFKQQDVIPMDEVLDALENTNRLADSVENIEIDTAIKYPISYGSKEEDERRLIELTWRKFDEKIRDGIIPLEQKEAFEKALNEELAVFSKLGMCSFMLSMSEIIGWCKENEMAIGTARGSVGGSRVAYVTDIIDLNPETWHTVFSRFCNENRTEIGDIDIDCIDKDRPEIFRYIINKFGEQKTARVAAYGTLADKAVIDDAGGGLHKRWLAAHPDSKDEESPYSLPKIKAIKEEYEKNPEATKKKHTELFYYFDGLLGTIVSQSVHPAGMVISPIELDDSYGVFRKDGERCLLLTMDDAHDCGMCKYDLLILKTVGVINDTCKLLGRKYPRTHEIDFTDQAVWDDMARSQLACFQMEGDFAYACLKQFKPRSIFDLSLVTAAIRPSGASYRDDLMARKKHKNPSAQIDKLLENEYGYLVYQESIIAFLQQICGLTGSEADTIRRGIAKKKLDLLQEWMPKILDGYCANSSEPREIAEQQCREYIQIITDASSYMFG